MNNLININNNNGTLTVTSREVAENFEKRHDHVVRDIEALKSQSPKLGSELIESSYITDRGRQYKEYLITEKGFTLLAMGFTGEKALEFKIKYIEAFQAMRDTLSKPMTMEQIVLFSAQRLVDIQQAQEMQERKLIGLAQTMQEVENKNNEMIEVMTTTVEDWRADTKGLIAQIVKNSGKNHQAVQREIYEKLTQQTGIRLEKRLENLKDRLAKSGATKTAVRNANKLDVIAGDKKLQPAYVAIVKELAVLAKVKGVK